MKRVFKIENYLLIPEGTYEAKILSIEGDVTKASGRPVVKIKIHIEGRDRFAITTGNIMLIQMFLKAKDFYIGKTHTFKVRHHEHDDRLFEEFIFDS